MKFFAITLLLACAATVCSLIVHPGSFRGKLSDADRCIGDHAPLAWLGSPSQPAGSVPTPAGSGTLSPPAPPLSKGKTLALIQGAAAKYHVPVALVASVVTAESNFNCTAVSPKGAIGLMQLMPETAQQFGANPAVPGENIEAGTRYLRWLIERYHNSRNAISRVIAAYNAGPAMVDRYRGVPPFRETRMYVARVLRNFTKFSGRRYTLAEMIGER
jgi:soluble lytic murein transglycosylase-like protein